MGGALFLSDSAILKPMAPPSTLINALALLSARCRELDLPGPLGLRVADFGDWVVDAKGVREGLRDAVGVLWLDRTALEELVDGSQSAQVLFATGRLTVAGAAEEVFFEFSPLLCWPQRGPMADFELDAL